MTASGIRTYPGLVFLGNLDRPAERVAGKRHLRRAQILNVLRREARSRLEVAVELGFNRRTVSLVIDEMVKEGLVREDEGRITTAGRRPIPVAFNGQAACVLGIDAGRHTTTARITNLLGQELAGASAVLDFGARGEKAPAAIRSFALGFLRQQAKDLPPLAGVGLATEGVIFSQAMHDDYGSAAEPARRGLEKALGVPVIVDGDSRFTALGEQWFGQAQGMRDVAVLNITDGLGMACILNGALLLGRYGWAGEIGHVPFGERGVPCHCGGTSCLENEASGSGLLRMAAQEGIAPPRGQETLTVAVLADQMRQGAAPARKVFGRFSKALALGAAVVADLFNPEAIILSGELAREAPLFLPAFQKEFDRLTVPRIRVRTRVLISDLCESAVTLGACAKVLNHIFDTSHVSLEDVL